jgi:hypothetical protein
VQAGSIPQLQIDAPAELADARARLASFDPNRLRGVMRLVGLEVAGDPIRVVLLPEGYEMAKRTPPPTAGYALPDQNLIVLFPARSPQYPHDTPEDVLHHEVAHVLMARAAGGAGLPLWFHEGLAVRGERTWGLEDQARLVSEMVMVSRTPLQAAKQSAFRGVQAIKGDCHSIQVDIGVSRFHGLDHKRIQPAPPHSGKCTFAEILGMLLSTKNAVESGQQWTTPAKIVGTDPALVCPCPGQDTSPRKAPKLAWLPRISSARCQAIATRCADAAW